MSTTTKTGHTMTVTGKCSVFGGPHDHGVGPHEGLALFDKSDLEFGNIFLAHQPPHTTGVARRLNPDSYYMAARWNYELTPREWLRSHNVMVTNPKTKTSIEAQPVDWGPNKHTGRVADLSPGLAKVLGLETNDVCTIEVPLP